MKKLLILLTFLFSTSAYANYFSFYETKIVIKDLLYKVTEKHKIDRNEKEIVADLSKEFKKLKNITVVLNTLNTDNYFIVENYIKYKDKNGSINWKFSIIFDNYVAYIFTTSADDTELFTDIPPENFYLWKRIKISTKE